MNTFKTKRRRKTGVLTPPKPCKVWDNVLLVFMTYDDETKRMKTGPGSRLGFGLEPTNFPSKAKANSAIWHEVQALIAGGRPPLEGRFMIMEEK